jgi:hypothetical protein
MKNQVLKEVSKNYRHEATSSEGARIRMVLIALFCIVKVPFWGAFFIFTFCNSLTEILLNLPLLL